MAEEKKPKIDLKARLGKAAATPPPGAAGIPVPAPTPGANAAPAAVSSNPLGGGLPVPPGIPVGPPPAFKSPAATLDPSNPLAAAVAPARPVPSRPPAPPQPQRIEVDEMAVQVARKGARKQGLVAGLVAAVIFAAIGYIAGGASAESKARAASVNHAKSLATEVGTAKDQLKTLAEKVEAGRVTLVKERKFPDTLAKDLGGINVDFDGSKLAGVRFSGFSTETTTGLVEFITSVQNLNDRKTALAALLSKLQKPLTEQLAGGGAQKIQFVALIEKDAQKQPFAVLAPLTKPIDVAGGGPPNLPTELTATNPLTRANVSAPKLTNLDKGGAAYVIPKSIDAACPSETTGQLAQLAGQLNYFINEIRGEQAAAGGDVITETKPGLLEKADRLIVNLNKVQ